MAKTMERPYEADLRIAKAAARVSDPELYVRSLRDAIDHGYIFRGSSLRPNEKVLVDRAGELVADLEFRVSKVQLTHRERSRSHSRTTTSHAPKLEKIPGFNYEAFDTAYLSLGHYDLESLRECLKIGYGGEEIHRAEGDPLPINGISEAMIRHIVEKRLTELGKPYKA